MFKKFVSAETHDSSVENFAFIIYSLLVGKTKKQSTGTFVENVMCKTSIYDQIYIKT